LITYQQIYLYVFIFYSSIVSNSFKVVAWMFFYCKKIDYQLIMKF